MTDQELRALKRVSIPTACHYLEDPNYCLAGVRAAAKAGKLDWCKAELIDGKHRYNIDVEALIRLKHSKEETKA